MSKLVNVIKAITTKELSDKINQFIIDYPVKIIDIQYQAGQRVNIGINDYGTEKRYVYQYSALIIYKYSIMKEFQRWMHGIKPKRMFKIMYKKDI